MGRPDTRTAMGTRVATRLARFLDLERRQRLLGRHRAVADLHRRTGPNAGARLRHYLRIERGHEA